MFDVLFIQKRKTVTVQKYSEKATSPKKKKEETRVAVGTHACMYGHTYSKSMDQPGKVASPARGQLIRKNEYLPVRVRA